MSLDKRVLILSVDRDNDIGIKTGVKGPILGRKNILDTAVSLAVKDPTESDMNVLFDAVKLYNDYQGEFENLEVAALTGDEEVGIKSDKAISDQLDTVLEKFDADSIIFVSDGREDENVIPIIQSKREILSKERLIVQQSESIEDTYFILQRYLANLLEDRKTAGLVFGLPGVIILILALSSFLEQINFTIYDTPWNAGFGLVGVGIVSGIFLFMKGFGLEEYMTFKNFNYLLYSLSIILGVVGFYRGIELTPWEILLNITPRSILSAVGFIIQYSFPYLPLGVLTVLFCNAFRGYIEKSVHFWYHVILFAFGFVSFSSGYLILKYTNEEITGTQTVFGLIVLSFLFIFVIIEIFNRRKNE
jgi:putative membrane protein